MKCKYCDTQVFAVAKQVPKMCTLCGMARDEFAAAALTGIMYASLELTQKQITAVYSDETTAEVSFRVADAMMEARKK